MRNRRNRKENFIKFGHFIPQAAKCLALLLCLSICLSACGASKADPKETQAEAAMETAEDAGREVPAAAETAAGAGQEDSSGADEKASSTSAGQTERSNEEDGTANPDSGKAKKAGRPLIGVFETLDLDGNAVTEEIFSRADVTFINVWGTFCPPCIGEMPELEKIHQELPDNMQMIGILFDVKSQDVPQYPKAIEIVEDAGVTYPSLIGNESMTGFLRSVHAVPTSFFVDSDGYIIGSPVVGADPDTYRMRLEELEEEYGKD